MSAKRPPVLARWLAWLLVPEREREFVLGDLEEGFHDHLATLPPRAMSQRRFVRLLGVFAAVALVLVSAGLYGVTAAGVAERRREIGLRSALGASRPQIVSTVVSRSATLLGFGLALGVVGAVSLNRFLRSVLFGVSPADPLTILSMIGVLLVVAVLASLIPVGRAVAVDPATTLRAE